MWGKESSTSLLMMEKGSRSTAPSATARVKVHIPSLREGGVLIPAPAWMSQPGHKPPGGGSLAPMELGNAVSQPGREREVAELEQHRGGTYAILLTAASSSS